MKTTARLLALLLALCLMVGLCACGDGEQKPEGNTTVTTTKTETTTTTKAEETAAFQVKVVDQNGNPVSGTMIQICKDTCIPKMSDENGVATFNIEITDGYKLSVLTCPAGYTYTGEAEVYLESGSTEITVQLQSEA